MAQGKAWKPDEVSKIMNILAPYFKLGCSITKACNYAGMHRTTVQTWIENDEKLRLEVTAWQNEVNVAARKVWSKAISGGDVPRAIDWLVRKEKDEFSDRKEFSGPDGKPIPIMNVLENDSYN